MTAMLDAYINREIGVDYREAVAKACYALANKIAPAFQVIRYNLCVLPEYRHEGIGHSLLLHSFDTAKEYGCTKMNIGIVEENAVLRMWYGKHGYIHTGTKKYDFFPFTCGYLKRIIEND